MSDVFPQQPLYLVFGGELEDVSGVSFRDVQGLDLVGIFSDYDSGLLALHRGVEAVDVDRDAARPERVLR
ncbi:DUF4170 domain-containing protein [Hansschlegelia beijingensis]